MFAIEIYCIFQTNGLTRCTFTALILIFYSWSWCSSFLNICKLRKELMKTCFIWKFSTHYGFMTPYLFYTTSNSRKNIITARKYLRKKMKDGHHNIYWEKCQFRVWLGIILVRLVSRADQDGRHFRASTRCKCS